MGYNQPWQQVADQTVATTTRGSRTEQTVWVIDRGRSDRAEAAERLQTRFKLQHVHFLTITELRMERRKLPLQGKHLGAVVVLDADTYCPTDLRRLHTAWEQLCVQVGRGNEPKLYLLGYSTTAADYAHVQDLLPSAQMLLQDVHATLQPQRGN